MGDDDKKIIESLKSQIKWMWKYYEERSDRIDAEYNLKYDRQAMDRADVNFEIIRQALPDCDGDVMRSFQDVRRMYGYFLVESCNQRKELYRLHTQIMDLKRTISKISKRKLRPIPVRLGPVVEIKNYHSKAGDIRAEIIWHMPNVKTTTIGGLADSFPPPASEGHEWRLAEFPKEKNID